MNIQENVKLGPLTTLEVGGPARFFVEAETENDIIDAFEFAHSINVPVFVLGGGSNVVVSDDGFAGLVIHVRLKGIHIDGAQVNASAGEDWDSLVKRCVDSGISGVECLSGIPGTVGGTPVQNVGAYGQEVSESISVVRCFDRQRREVIELSNESCRFSYRTSIFNTVERDHYVVLSVSYCMTQDGPPKIAYKDLIDHFDGHQASLSEVRDAVLSIRRSKSMVIDPIDENRRSAGSFFKNPLVTHKRFDEIASEWSGTIPHFAAPDDMIKVPAAWLIEQAGYQKGYFKGNVGISTKHTLAIINRGGATAAEIISFKNDIQAAVSEKFDIDLVPEPNFIGSFGAKH